MQNKKGIIALDIDGTLSHSCQEVPSEVISYLSSLNDKDWDVILVTGRSFASAYPLIENFSFPFKISCHNGADLLTMPSKKLMNRQYFSMDRLKNFESLFADKNCSIFLFSGVEYDDICYYQPHLLNDEFLKHLNERKLHFKDEWLAVDDFNDLNISDFAAIKTFGDEAELREIAKVAETSLSAHTTVIRDPFLKGSFVLVITNEEATKGQVLSYYKEQHHQNDCLVIAAGDDNNDRSMLEFADLRIVMADGSPSLRELATVIAKPAKELGIIDALEQVIQSVDSSLKKQS
jgi:Cof subfamily protein (haloacid dehalogenase superfamily)